MALKPRISKSREQKPRVVETDSQKGNDQAKPRIVRSEEQKPGNPTVERS